MKSIYFLPLIVQALMASPSMAFSLSPVKINLGKDTNSQDIEIFNDNPTEKLRIQVDSYKWGQNTQGESILEPTREVVAFPTLLEIPPNSKRTVRVGVRVASASSEKTYRVIIKQLRNANIGEATGAKQRKSELSLLVNMSLPVYVEPINVLRKAELADGRLKDRKLVFIVSNTGNVRVEPGEAHLKALTANGEVVGDTKIKLGSILANVKREFIVDLPKYQCERVRSVAIDATNPPDSNQRLDNLKITILTPNGVCHQEIGKND
jgi:fimbrial chaperone protein